MVHRHQQHKGPHLGKGLDGTAPEAQQGLEQQQPRAHRQPPGIEPEGDQPPGADGPDAEAHEIAHQGGNGRALDADPGDHPQVHQDIGPRSPDRRPQ